MSPREEDSSVNANSIINDDTYDTNNDEITNSNFYDIIDTTSTAEISINADGKIQHGLLKVENDEISIFACRHFQQLKNWLKYKINK